ncbi:MAG TPA: uroporphyrinogen-III C-methyltransferase [Verrucomicrobiota bacterium]|nr:uroporphyrinogen-III C-methyltransferase [Verrucomicrobiota bacterium]
MNKVKGKVFLVGTGPGDTGLLTLRAVEVLNLADAIIYDALVNPAVFNYVKTGAQIIPVGKTIDEINSLMLKYTGEGKTVVRLINGDPFTFGHGEEEALFLAENNIPFEIIPGVSSLQAVPIYAGIPLTYGLNNNVLTLASDLVPSEKNPSESECSYLANVQGTKVFLTEDTKINRIVNDMLKGGMSPETPVAVIQSGTFGNQKTLTGTLSTIAGTVEKNKIESPIVMVIGEVVKLRDKLNWFETRPLFGQRVVITRAKVQSGMLKELLIERGADVLEIPTIKIVPPENKEDLIDVLLGLNEYDWLVFTSPNGVTAFFEHFFKQFEDIRDIGGTRIAAIGPGTAEKLKEYHLKVDLMPEESIAANIAKAFAEYHSIENLKICLLRAEVANQELPKALEKLGAIVDDIACYKTVAETEDTNGDANRLLNEGADWILFTSGSTVENFHLRFKLPELLKRYKNIKLAAIGPETGKIIEKFGLKPTVVARVHNIDGLVDAVQEYVLKSRLTAQGK